MTAAVITITGGGGSASAAPAEASFVGTSIEVPPQPATQPVEPPPPLPPVFAEDGKTPAPFISSDAFAGPRPGYVFKAGADGLGYYRDKKA